MAMHDHRVFRHEGEWWGATILSGSGVSAGAIPRITIERAYFTPLYDPKGLSKSASLPAGYLNRINHASIVYLLEHAEPFGHRWEMVGYNQPDAVEFPPNLTFENPSGQRWAARRAPYDVGIRMRVGSEGRPPIFEKGPGLEVACLDDSALRGVVGLESEGALEVALAQFGKDFLVSLSEAVESTFIEYMPKLQDDSEF